MFYELTSRDFLCRGTLIGAGDGVRGALRPVCAADFVVRGGEITAEFTRVGPLGAVHLLVFSQNVFRDEEPTGATLRRFLIALDEVFSEDTQVSGPPAPPVLVGAHHLERVDLLGDAHVAESFDRSSAHHAREGLLHQLLHTTVAVMAAAALGLVRIPEEHHTYWADQLARRFGHKCTVETVVVQVTACVIVSHRHDVST